MERGAGCRKPHYAGPSDDMAEHFVRCEWVLQILKKGGIIKEDVVDLSREGAHCGWATPPGAWLHRSAALYGLYSLHNAARYAGDPVSFADCKRIFDGFYLEGLEPSKRKRRRRPEIPEEGKSDSELETSASETTSEELSWEESESSDDPMDTS